MIDYEKIFWVNFAKWSETHWKGTDEELAYRLNVSPPQLNNLKMGRRVGNENQRRWICKDLGLVYENMIELEPIFISENGESMELTPEDISKLISMADNMSAAYKNDIQGIRDDLRKLIETVDLLKKQCILTQGGLSELEKVARKEGK